MISKIVEACWEKQILYTYPVELDPADGLTDEDFIEAAKRAIVADGGTLNDIDRWEVR